LGVRSEASTAKKKSKNDLKIFADNAAKYQAEYEAAEMLAIVNRRPTKRNWGFYVSSKELSIKIAHFQIRKLQFLGERFILIRMLFFSKKM